MLTDTCADLEGAANVLGSTRHDVLGVDELSMRGDRSLVKCSLNDSRTVDKKL